MKNLFISKPLNTKGSIFGGLLILFLIWPNTEILSQKHKTHYSVHTSNHSGITTIQVSDKDQDFKIEYEGAFTLSEDDKDIMTISKGGFIEIIKSSFGNRRSIFIESDRNGNLVKKYFISRSEKNYLPEGKKWLGEILPEIVRSTVIAAESRVDRFYKKGGVNSVFSEIPQLKNGYVKSKYLRLLLEKDLNNTELIGVIDQAGRQIESDHHLAQLLKSNQRAFLASNETISAYISACGSIQSDHHKAQVLKKVINDSDITDAHMKSLLAITNDIQSDHHLSQLLIEILDKRPLNAPNIDEIIHLMDDIQSDHHKTRVLKKVVNDQTIADGQMKALLTASNKIKSDHQLGQLLVEILDKRTLNPQNLSEIISLLKNIQSDHQKTKILKKVINKKDIPKDAYEALIGTIGDIRSNSQLSQLVTELLREKDLTANELSDLLNRVNRSKSDSFKAGLYKKIADQNLSEAQLMTMLNLAAKIKSDSYLSQVLVAFSYQVRRSTAAVKSAYKTTAKSIESETYYGRALKAIE